MPRKIAEAVQLWHRDDPWLCDREAVHDGVLLRVFDDALEIGRRCLARRDRHRHGQLAAAYRFRDAKRLLPPRGTSREVVSHSSFAHARKAVGLDQAGLVRQTYERYRFLVLGDNLLPKFPQPTVGLHCSSFVRAHEEIPRHHQLATSIDGLADDALLSPAIATYCVETHPL